MENNRNAPATKGDAADLESRFDARLTDLEARFEARLDGRLDAMEARMTTVWHL